MNHTVAIVGISCRFPGGAMSPQQFWRLLMEGRDAVTEIGPERFNRDYYFHPDREEPGKSYTWAAGVLPDVRMFDADFFGISPREAEQMDPQQRFLLELTWEALENAGMPPRSLAGSDMAVYLGISATDYATLRFDDAASANAYFMTGNTLSVAANRISFIFDWHGPSMAVDTACSSSLVAFHEAHRAVASGEAPMSVVAGINMLLSPFPFVGFSKASMLSPDGRCKAFDASGKGYVRAEGGAVVILKPLDAAIRDGDTIHAVVRGIGTNADGRTRGIALPNGELQEALLRKVYAQAGVEADELSYLEAHGTGTAAGDPIEAGAIGRVLGQGRQGNKLKIGSVKTNIGHLESASGMAGLVKALLILQHETIPPSLHFETPNPKIDFDQLNLEVVTQPTPLPSGDKAPMVGVNSFGFGGTNAHLVLEAYRPASNVTPIGRKQPESLPPLVVTARHADALRAAAAAMADAVEPLDVQSFYDAAWTSAFRREWMPERLLVEGENPRAIAQTLREFAREGASPQAVMASGMQSGKLALVFSGNGAQWAGMMRQLPSEDPHFAAALKHVDETMMPYLGWSVAEYLRQDAAEQQLDRTDIAQPLLFAVQAAMIAVLRDKGVPFDAVFGHSVGEAAAAYAAGGLTLEQASWVIVERSRAQELTRGLGKMAAVGLAPEEAEKRIRAAGFSVEVAAVNSPKSVTLSGGEGELRQLEQSLTEEGVFFRLLDLDYAFHSRQMEPVEAPLLAALEGLEPGEGDIAFLSTVTGDLLETSLLVADYWWHNVREPVRFGDAVQKALEMGITHFLEVGPHGILRHYIKETAEAAELPAHIWSTARKGQPEGAHFRQAAAEAVLSAGEEGLRGYFPIPGRLTALPTYAWQHQPYWYPATVESTARVHGRERHPLLGTLLQESPYVWEKHFEPALMPWLQDHQVGGAIVFPAAGFIEMALAAGRALHADKPPVIRQMEIRRPLVLHSGQSRAVRLHMFDDQGSYAIESRPRFADEPWIQHVVGTLASDFQPPLPLDKPAGKAKAVARDRHYATAEALGLHYGDAFQSVQDAELYETAVEGRLTVPAAAESAMRPMLLPPVVSDGAFQLLFDLLEGQGRTLGPQAYLPARMGYIRLEADARPAARARVRLVRRSARSVIADIDLLDAKGEVVARLRQCRFQKAELQQQRHWSDLMFGWTSIPLASDATSALAGQTVGDLPKPAQDYRGFRDALAAEKKPEARREKLREALAKHPAWLPALLPLIEPVERAERPQWLGTYLEAVPEVTGMQSLLARRASLPGERPTLLVLAPETIGLVHRLAARFPAEAAELVVTHPDGSMLQQLQAESSTYPHLSFRAWEEAKAADIALCAWLHPSYEADAAFWRQAALWLKPDAPCWIAAEPHGASREVLFGPSAPLAVGSEWKELEASDVSGLRLHRLVSARPLAEETPDTGQWLMIGEHTALAEALCKRSQKVDSADIARLKPEGRPLLFAEGLSMTDGETLVQRLLTLVQSLAGKGEGQPIAVLTRDAWSGQPLQAGLWGMVRVLVNEHPELRFRLIDLQCDDYAALADALLRHPDEQELLVTAQGVRALRMTPQPPQGQKEQMRLDTPAPGLLDRLQWQQSDLPAPQGQEIQLRVDAAGLNFRDVMWAMGLLPDEAVEDGFAGPTLGMECAGEITAIGPECTDFKIGDQVLAFAPSCFARYVTTGITAAAKLPKGISAAEAATIPAPFFTAYYALYHLAQLQPGEKVLIHGAAGGVGLAAIQLAKHRGAEIFATAGAEEKHSLLKALGVDHILRSRDLSFADDIRRLTGGQGVDVVLNSLAGEAMQASLDLLKPFGRFLELGKRDFYANSRMAMRALRNNIAYHGIDADQLLTFQPALSRTLFREVMQLFADGVLHPLPYHAFPASRVVDAFRTMQQSRHIGKIVVTMEETAYLPAVPLTQPFACRQDATYLITGGLGGFGLATAQWLADHGARHLILTGRRGATPDAQPALNALEKQGVKVLALAADVTNEQDVIAMLGAAGAQGWPALAGVIHAAMVLDDKLARNMDGESLRKVWQPKVTGAEWLDKHSRDLKLDWMLFYSSATTYLGNPGQANYVAANMALEALAAKRSAEGLPTLAVAWGPIDDAGYLTRHQEVKQALAGRIGKEPLTAAKALFALGQLLASGVTGSRAVFPLEWPTIRRALPLARHATYRWLNATARDEADEACEGINFQELAHELSRDELTLLLQEMLVEQLSHILRLAADKIDIHRSIFDMGMDSLMTVELGMAIERQFGVELPVMALSDGMTIARLGERILEEVLSEKTFTESGDADITAAQASAVLSRHAVDLDGVDAQQVAEERLRMEPKEAGLIG